MISVGVMYYIALVPCVISSLIAHGIASYFNVTNEFFAIENIPDFTILNSVKISALAILCALVSILFVWPFTQVRRCTKNICLTNIQEYSLVAALSS